MKICFLFDLSSINKMMFYLFIILNAKIVMSQHTEESDCLIAYKIYHKQTRMCYEPFEQGPCPQGKWLVLGSSTSGKDN